MLDGFGGLHPFGGAPRIARPGGYRQADVFRDLVMISPTGGYAIDTDGVPWPVGDAPAITAAADLVRRPPRPRPRRRPLHLELAVAATDASVGSCTPVALAGGDDGVVLGAEEDLVEAAEGGVDRRHPRLAVRLVVEQVEVVAGGGLVELEAHVG